MKFDIPFTNDTIQMFHGKTLVVSSHNRNESLFRASQTITVKSGGDFDGRYFEVSDGILRMLNKDGLFAEFSGIATIKGIVYATGDLATSIPCNGFNHATLHERILLDKSQFGICISSHTNYAPTTLPVLLSSLRKAGYDMSKTIVVVGGYKGDKTETLEGAKIIYEENNGQGFGGLTAISSEFPYWLLLHDTCEASRGFLNEFPEIDIGLSPDVVRLREDTNDWMGFYATDFILKKKDEVARSPKISLNVISQTARIVSVIPGKVIISGEKDVYRTGCRRIVESLPIGMRKFRSVSNRRKLP